MAAALDDGASGSGNLGETGIAHPNDRLGPSLRVGQGATAAVTRAPNWAAWRGSLRTVIPPASKVTVTVPSRSVR
jgi:hypothetical protein